MAGAFVRAKSNKITVTETYSYKTEVSDHTSLSFLEADGKIKVEFLYDGELRDFRWKLRVFWKGLCDKWIALNRFSTWWKQSWKPLRWVYKKFDEKVLGKKSDSKLFYIAAIEDAKKHSKNYQMAQVGYLALQGYQKPNFAEDWPKDKALKLEIPIDNFEREIAQSRKYEICYNYSLQEPKAPPVRLHSAKLTDEDSSQSNQQIWSGQANDHFEELHSKYDEILRLEIEFEIDGGQPGVDADGKIEAKVIERWWREGEKLECEIKQQEEQKNDQRKDGKEKRGDSKQEESPLDEQIHCLKGLCEIDVLVRFLRILTKRGGYLLIHLNKSDDINTLKKRLLKAAFRCSPFVPIFEPYDYTVDKKPLVVVPIPMVANRQSDYRSSHLHIVSNVRPDINAVDAIIKGDDIGQLAKTLSALANTHGGLVFLEAKQNDNRDREVLDKTVGKAIWSCQPHLTGIYLEDTRRVGWIISIERASANVHSVDENVYKWKNGKYEPLDSDETYELIKERCTQNYPLMKALPVITHAYIEWPHFDVRESQGVHYDPQKQTIKWSDEIRFRLTSDYRFKVNLPLRMNRPIELYNQDEIRGQVRIDFKEQLLSGLEIDYFNALGEHRPRPQGGPPVIEKTSKVIFEFTIWLDSIFRRRWFTSKRQLEFEGVKLDRDRLKDIQGMLADLGLQNITVKPERDSNYWRIFSARDDVMDSGEYIIEGFKPGPLKINLYVRGQSAEIVRERTEGDRLDKMRIPTGRIRIIITGEVRGQSPRELSVLMNRLQQLLKERFEVIRFQIA